MSTTRPTSFDDLIGLDEQVQAIRYDIQGAIQRNQKIQSFIIGGGAGLGKSTIGNLIASMTGGEVVKILASDLTPNLTYDLAQRCKDGDVIYLEEAHAIPKKVGPILLEWIENNKILSDVGPLEAPKTVFIFPTTDAGMILPALRSRCQYVSLNFYSVEHLKQIIDRAARLMGHELNDDEALTMIARSSRGTPRTAIENRLSTVLNVMAVDKIPFCVDTVAKAFAIKKINPYGLEKADLEYCSLLYDYQRSDGGKPVSLLTLAQLMGMSQNVLTDIIERYLVQIGFVRKVAKGRILTNFACECLNFPPLVEFNDFLDNEEVMADVLHTLETGKVKTVKEFAGLIGLKYPQDRIKIRSVLQKFGYKAVQKKGLVKLHESSETNIESE